MAVIFELNEEQQAEWNSWKESRPQIIKDLCERFPPNKLYRLKDSGSRVTVYSYSEDGTMVVIVSSYYNFVMFERKVFGIKPEDLDECDLPTQGELIGAVLTESEDIDAFISANRKDILNL